MPASVVIVGSGFGGLTAAKAFKRADVDVKADIGKRGGNDLGAAVVAVLA